MDTDAPLTVALYEGTPGPRYERPGIRLLGTSAATLVSTAVAAVDGGATRVELCGGIGVDEAAQVSAALPAHADVRLVRYGFESLELIAAYKEAYGRGDDTGRAAFLVLDPGADPAGDRLEHADAVVVAVPDEDAVAVAVRELHERHPLGLVELYGGLGVGAAAAARDATGGEVPIGFADD